MKLVPGLYEALITKDRARALAALERIVPRREALNAQGAPHYLARHLYELLLKALRSQPGESPAEKLEAQLGLVSRIVELLGQPEASGVDAGDDLELPAAVLLALTQEAQGLGQTVHPERPTLPLRHSDLIVNGPRDLRLGPEIRKELASADRVDLLVAFLKHSGMRVIKQELAEFCARRPGKLRVLTTTYMGASEVEALDLLASLGAELRVSYDDRRTRLHAKAWLFHRASGYSTGLVGSSNLSRSALLDGCEWNVRLSAVDNHAILAKFQSTFDQYWNEGEFEPYSRERFLQAQERRRDPQRDALATALQLRPFPHQAEVLEALALERAAGHWKNLVVAATGTGKTVIAALDYARVRRAWGEARLLFVAHREEILQQSLACFRAAVGDGHFGELLVGKHKPVRGEHVFASIQSLRSLTIPDPAHYDVVIVDEFHHAEAPSYAEFLEHGVRPRLLLGLTATPERSDGRSILHWFDGRVAAETRLWDALDLGLLVPFQYFGVFDGTDLSQVNWRAGRYDTKDLERRFAGDTQRAEVVLRAIQDKVRDPRSMRALGFCVSVKHAEFMAEFCRRRGLQALALTGDTPDGERREARRKLAQGEVQALFTVDLFNEGVDIPAVDTVLFLRPTESATVFLQQLGRGLRLADDKDCLTVLDFIGLAHRRFRFDRRFRAFVRGSTRAATRRAVEEGFPHLPAGCELQLDEQSQAAVLRNLRSSLGATTASMAEDLAGLGDVSLGEFLEQADLGLEDVYRGSSWNFTALKHKAGLRAGPAPVNALSRALGRMLHVDDAARLGRWLEWLAGREPPRPDPTDPLQLMLLASSGHVRRPVSELGEVLGELWRVADLHAELRELLGLLDDRRRRTTYPLDDLPFHVHATYSRDEISAGLGQVRNGKLLRTQGGVYRDEASRADILYVTLQKSEKEFTPTTLYDDYPISTSLFHWESQAVTRADSETGRRYQEHLARGWRVLLFVRESRTDERGLTRPYAFLGPVRYVSHESEKPMRVTWQLERPMPAEFFNRVKLAAG
ncbi:MAG: DUF3427 domain-containing protein [Planctomycetota bacterium]